MIYLKINKTENSEIVAICDPDLIGKTFSEKNLKLDINEKFYKGDMVNEQDAEKILKNAKNINIVGRESVNLAVKLGIIDKSKIIKIKNIPHAIILEI